MSIVEKIGIENLLSAILVKERVRPAMLLQPANYKEATGKDPKTKSILKAIQENFPELKYSKKYEKYQGIIISHKNYDNQNVSLKRMGEILGYPCANEFESLDTETQDTYTIELEASLHTETRIQLFVNVCKSTDKKTEFEELAKKAKIVFDKEEYKKMLGKMSVDSIKVNIFKNISIKTLINKLVKNEILSKEEIDKILNILYNLGFEIEFQFLFQDHFDYKNPLHRGILLSLLINYKDNILEPFVPLQKYPEQDKKVYEITEKWGKDLIDVIEKTKIVKEPFIHKNSKKQNSYKKNNFTYKKRK